MKSVLSAILALSLNVASAADRAPAIPDYPADKVAPNTYVIHGPTEYPSPENKGFMNNPAFVVTKAGVVIIDPGSSVQTGEMVLRQIRKLTGKPVVAVLDTHAHGDHWLGNHGVREAYPQVPIYGHPKMIEAVNKGIGEEWVQRMESSTKGATRGTLPMGPNHAVKHGDVLKIGGMTFRFHHFGNAHTNNDLMIEVPEEKVLFLADNVNNRRIVRMDDGKFVGSVSTIDPALKIPVQILVPGHGRTGGWEIVHAYRDYLNGLYSSVKRYYGEGMSDFEMKDKVAADLSRFKDWPGFEEDLGKQISLAILEIESDDF
jgi:glyoxylase-like metal-dependent hydrolase (beta-lactamase superfamily II)